MELGPLTPFTEGLWEMHDVFEEDGAIGVDISSLMQTLFFGILMNLIFKN